MSRAAQRVRCAAAPLFRDKHQAVDRWWAVTSPDGEVYDFCSGCCLLEFATLGALLYDVKPGDPMYDGRPHVHDGEAA